MAERTAIVNEGIVLTKRVTGAEDAVALIAEAIRSERVGFAFHSARALPMNTVEMRFTFTDWLQRQKTDATSRPDPPPPPENQDR